MILERFPELASLSIEEKQTLFEELGREIAASDNGEPDPEIVQMLEERWKEHEKDPSKAVTLEDFRQRIGFES
ncbi:MAG: addiction module protein [Verrucomicrobiota bacterium]